MALQNIADIAETELGDDSALLDRLRVEGSINLPRAWEVMERQGLDGLVLGEPINVFHATGHWPFTGRTRPGAPPTLLVVISRDPGLPVALVASRFYYYYTYVDGGFSEDRPVYLHADTAEQARGFFEDRGEAPLDVVELQRATLASQSAAARPLQDGAIKALRNALKDMGLHGGAIGYDHLAVGDWLRAGDLAGSLHQADDALRQIRLVKSPLEIALMRRSSAINVAAIHAAVRQVRAGASYRDLRRAFFTEAAARDGEGVSLSVDRVTSELGAGRLREGQAFMVDAVSRSFGYHGDYGRTIVLGEPSANMRNAIAAVSTGWEAIREALRPGLRYSQIGEVGRQATRKAGHSFRIAFSPHSVGLMHTDEPIRWVDGFPAKADLTLEPGMIISVDCPIVETGLGGSAHVEDLMLITADGAEPLHDVAAAGLVV